ncbi:MAG TPA: hypothetical protein PL045_12355 [Chitinophagaceae bacterium]|nr:hypothetical protein [Chitinophagaceae bacterium]
MPKEIRIFKTFEEQEAYHLEQMRNSTVQERFAALLEMQRLTNAFHKAPADNKRKIIIHHGYLKQ